MPSTSNFDLTYNQQNVVAGGALSNPAATTGTSAGSGVTKILSGGSNVTLSPTSGVGDVTISVTSGGSGTVTEVKGQGTVNGITLTGDVTTSGYLTLGGTLGSIANTQLSNSTITIAGNSTALGGTVTQDQITGLSATTAGIVKHTTSANTLALATAGTDYSAGTSSLASGIVKSTTSTGALSIAAASDINSTLGTQSANVVYAGPSSGTTPANPAFRSLVSADIPSLNYVASSGGTATNLTLSGTLKDSNSSSAGTSGQVLSSTVTGTKWITPSSGGSGVTQVNQGTGIALSPNPITTTGTVALDSAYAGNGIGTVNGIARGNGSGTITTASSGTDYSAGTSSLATGVLKSTTTTGALSIAGGSDLNSTFGSQTAKTFYAAPNGSSGTPSFRAIVASDVPTLNQNTTGSAGSVTGLSVTSGKTLTASNTLTLAGTDGSTLNVGSGGTLGSAAYTASSSYVAASSGTATNLTLSGSLTASSSTGTSGYYLQSTGSGVQWAAGSGGLPSGSQGQALLYGSSGGAFLNTAINVLTYGTSFSAISSAISAAQTAGTSVYFPQGSYTISSNLGYNVTCPVIIDGSITISSGVTLTLNGTVWAPLKQVFTVNGSLKIGSNTPYIYPEWFGTPKNGTSDDSTGINAALNAATTITIPSSVPAVQYIVLTGNYTLNSTITITGGKMFKVIGGAQFTAGTATDAIVYDGTGSNNGSSVQGDIPTCVNFSGTALYLKGTKVMNLKFFGTLGCGVGVKVGAVSGSDSLDNKIECMFFENTTVGFFITTDGSTNPSGSTVALQGNELYCNFYTLDSQPSSAASAVYWDNVNLTNCDGNSVRVKAIEFNGKTNVYGFRNASSYAVNGWEVVSDDWFGGITSSNVSSAKFASGYFQACTFKFLMRGSLGSLSWSNMGVYGEYNRMEFRNGGAGSSSYIGQPVLQTSANSRSSFNSYPIFQNRVVCSYTFAFDFGVGSVATFYAYSVAADGYTNGASNCLNAIPITSLGIMIDAIYDNGSVNTNEIVIKARNVSGSVIPTGTLWSIMLVAGV